jgi:meso-butanediol dehydrogenase/(S,S)-butanediol dehydrogenase/diacetyl reductase
MGARMQGKSAIVTGAGRGIGATIGELFCAEGGNVMLVDRDPDTLDETLGRIRSLAPQARAERFVADVSVPDDAARAVAKAVEAFGGISVLVNNAAVRNHASVAESDIKEWERLLSINLLGAVNVCKAAVGELRRSGKASIVNMSSCYGVVGRQGMPIYDATKAALLSLTRSLACEEAANGIRVNAVCPGGTLTPFTIGRGVAAGRDPDDMKRDVKPESLLRRWATPQEIAYPVLWLASDESSYITGTTIMVDGGLHIM